MKNAIKVLGTIAITVLVMITVIACGPPRLRGTVSIDGEHLLGGTLTANTSSLGGNGIISYQWMRNGGTVDDMIGVTYTLQDVDKDAVISVTVIRSDNSGSITSAPVTISYPLLGGTVNIQDNSITLTANTASLGGSGIISYQWIRNGDIVDGMNQAMYILQDIDRNAAITVTVSRSGNSGGITSAPVTFDYLIGDTGPGGGRIFYRDLDGFIMTDTGEKAYYLEAAPVNQGTSLAWTSSPYRRFMDTGQAIGTGRKNTALILAVDAAAPAALACRNYNGGGKADWFLPSFRELTEMYKTRSYLGISSGDFWSSSQYGQSSSPVSVLTRNFHGGTYSAYFGQQISAVRAIRAF